MDRMAAVLAILIAMSLRTCAGTPDPTPAEIAEEEYYDSLELLAACVEAEAGNQGLEGKKLVAEVVLNRVRSDKYPNTISEVITQRNQFTTWSNGMIDRAQITQESYDAVASVINDGILHPDILFFTAGRYSEYGKPAFSYKDHYFSY